MPVTQAFSRTACLRSLPACPRRCGCSRSRRSHAQRTVTAQPLVVNADDSIEKLLGAERQARHGEARTERRADRRRPERLANVVHLGELAGRELFDAAVDIKQVRAVIVRTKN